MQTLKKNPPPQITKKAKIDWNKVDWESTSYSRGSLSPKKTIKKRRCPKGWRRNKKTGDCDPIIKTMKKGRCPKGTKRNKKPENVILFTKRKILMVMLLLMSIFTKI